MPNPVMPSAIVTALHRSVPASGGHLTSSSATDASAVSAIGDADATAEFAALLGQQMAVTALAADELAQGPTSSAAVPPTAYEEPADQPADLSALLQALMLPMAAKREGAASADAEPVPIDDVSNEQSPVLLTAAQPRAAISQSESSLPTDFPVFDQDSPQSAKPVAGDEALPASVAEVAAKPAEHAVRELPVQAPQPDLPPAAALVAHSATAAGRIEREHLVLSTPVAAPNWHEDLGGKLSMLIGKEASSAELILTPPNLGRVEVQLSVSSDQTGVAFVVATPAAREALEQALPKLREFLADAGINLTQASVGGDAQAGHGNAHGKRGGRSGHDPETGSLTDAATGWTSMRRVEGVVDTFA